MKFNLFLFFAAFLLKPISEKSEQAPIYRKKVEKKILIILKFILDQYFVKF